jgi:hypothetical protein
VNSVLRLGEEEATEKIRSWLRRQAADLKTGGPRYPWKEL